MLVDVGVFGVARFHRIVSLVRHGVFSGGHRVRFGVPVGGRTM